MLKEIETHVFDKYIKGMIVYYEGEKAIAKESIDRLNLSQEDKNFIIYIINKQGIRIFEEKITRKDRSPYVRDNNYGDIKTNGLQNLDKDVMSKVNYSIVSDKEFEDYSELDEYLENRFIPTYALLKQRKNDKGEKEEFLSIRLYHILALRLSEVELEHVMAYLQNQNIRVGGKGATLDKEFENFDYVSTYKEAALPLSISANLTLEKIHNYKNTNDQKLRDEIIMDNMRLVPYVSYRYAILTGINQHELESYGYEGLLIALENFDFSFGCRFSTYAVSYIRSYILSGIQEIFLGKKDKFYFDYVYAKKAVEKKWGITLKESPNLIDEVIDMLVINGKIENNEDSREYAKRRIMYLVTDDISLDDEEMLENLIENGQLIDSQDYCDIVANKMLQTDINKVLDQLTEEEAKVIRLRFGLQGSEQKTLREIAQMFGCSVCKIENIEKKAIRRMKHPIRAVILKDYYQDFETERYDKNSMKK